MTNIKLNEVHIGREIKSRFLASQMSKSEFGRQIGVSQQHVNRLFDKESVDTDRLSKISLALGFNFFSLYCEEAPTKVSANLSAVSIGDGEATNTIGDESLASQVEKYKQAAEIARSTETLLREQIEQLKSSLDDKIEIINLLKNQANMKDP